MKKKQRWSKVRAGISFLYRPRRGTVSDSNAEFISKAKRVFKGSFVLIHVVRANNALHRPVTMQIAKLVSKSFGVLTHGDNNFILDFRYNISAY